MKPTKTYIDIVLYTIPLRICGIYYEGSPMVMYYPDGSGHPGDPAEFEILGVWVGDVDIIEILEAEILEEIESVVLEKVES